MEPQDQLPDFRNFKARLKIDTYGDYKAIDLTNEQYERLLVLMQCGISAIDVITDKLCKQLCDVEQNIWEYSKQFSSDLVYFDSEFDYFFASEKLGEQCNEIIDKYEERTVFKVLVDKLVQKEEKLSGKKFSQNQKEELKNKYRKEIAINGIQNLYLKRPEKDQPI